MSAAILSKQGLRRSKNVSPAEDLALTKAAAWAWLQRAAAAGRHVSPFETAAASRRRGPSRYKLETESGTASCPSLIRRGSLSLLDGYEIGRISSDLDSLIVEARRQKQPEKTPKKSTGFWARHVAWFCGSTSSRRVSDALLVPRPLSLDEYR